MKRPAVSLGKEGKGSSGMEKCNQTLYTDQPFQQNGAANSHYNLLGWERGWRAARGCEWRSFSKEVCSDEKQQCKSLHSRTWFQAGEELVLPREEEIMSQGIKNRSCEIRVPTVQVQTEGPTDSHSIFKCVPLQKGANSSWASVRKLQDKGHGRKRTV